MLFVSQSLIFDDFRFNVPTRELLRAGRDGSMTPIPLGSRAAEILLLMLQRHGELVSKNEIMDTVWPGTAVEESNLTVQISALRRALDEGRNGASCIQTVSGRGYRFALTVVEHDPTWATHPTGAASAPVPVADELSPRTSGPLPQPTTSSPANFGDRGVAIWPRWGAGIVALLCAAIVVMEWPGYGSQRGRSDPPAQRAEPSRLSIAVLPFANSSGEQKDDEVAAALTEDFTAGLAELRGSFVVAHSMAQAVAVRKLPLPAVGSELGVRYVLEGNIRRSSGRIELNIQLSEVASGANIWTTQFHDLVSEQTEIRRQITQRLMFPLRMALMDAEAVRISALQEGALTADDLLLKVRASDNHQPITPARNAENLVMLERALALDPSSAEVMIRLADQLLLPIIEYQDRSDLDARLLRARSLAARARALAAGSESMLVLQGRILRAENRFDEALAAYTSLMQSSGRYHAEVAWCLIYLGRSAEAIPMLQEAIRLDREPRRYLLYHALGRALVRLGRDEEAINWLRAAREHSSGSSPAIDWALAMAYGHTGKIADARRELQQYLNQRRAPDAWRMRHMVQPTPAAAEQHAREIKGLVIAGLRDHGSENFDPGLPITTGVRSPNLFSPTPTGAPGVSTIKTSELRALIAEGGANDDAPPILLSTDCSDCLDISIPGTVYVPEAFRNGVLDDEKRRALKSFMDRLLHGDQTRRLVTLSWNMAGWESRNLAIELVALGYPNVSWYRGGLEAWDVAGLPVTRPK